MKGSTVVAQHASSPDGGVGRKWRGDEDRLSNKVPLSYDELWIALSMSKSLYEAATRVTEVVNRQGRKWEGKGGGYLHEVRREDLWAVLKFQPVFQEYIEDAGKRWLAFWPQSATDQINVDYPWVASLLRRRGQKLLAYEFFPENVGKSPKCWKWPSLRKLVSIVLDNYPPERWVPRTPRRQLIQRLCLPKVLAKDLFLSLDKHVDRVSSKR